MRRTIPVVFIYKLWNVLISSTVLANTRSGLATINDATLHIQTVRFGGIGESGHGAYRGKASFDVFVHQRPIFNTPSWAEALVSTRYPPYAGKLGRFKAIFSLTPDFDRQGRRNRLGWLQYVLTLGGGTAKAVAGRAAVLAVSKLNWPVYIMSSLLSSLCQFNVFTPQRARHGRKDRE